MFDLDDVGREVHVRIKRFYTHVDIDTRIAMVIKAPRGAMALFDYTPYRRRLTPTKKFENKQCKAIRAFMKEHKDD